MSFLSAKTVLFPQVHCRFQNEPASAIAGAATGTAGVPTPDNRQIANDCYIKLMFHIALYEPEIPPNAGNIARLCAATGSRLHLIGRLGFRLDDKHLQRAGLDYWPHVDLVRHVSWEDFLNEGLKVWLVDCPASLPYTQAQFQDGDCLLFGSESKGLPRSLRDQFASRTIGIPMPTGNVRSLNLATSVGIVLYEALRQVNRR
jgi:tRNA (cytidine/uridine-2'-O-)-methyltransferase